MGKVLRGQCDRQAIYDRPVWKSPKMYHLNFQTKIATELDDNRYGHSILIFGAKIQISLQGKTFLGF